MKYKVKVNNTVMSELRPMIEDCAGSPSNDKDGMFTSIHRQQYSNKNVGKKHWTVSLTFKQVQQLQYQIANQIEWLERDTIPQIWYNADDVQERGEQLAEVRKDIATLKKTKQACEVILEGDLIVDEPQVHGLTHLASLGVI